MPQEVVFVLGDQSKVIDYLSDEERIRSFNEQNKEAPSPEITKEMVVTFLPVIMAFQRQLMRRIEQDGLNYTEVTVADVPYVRIELDSVPLYDSNVQFGVPIIGTVAPLRNPEIRPTITGEEIIHHYVESPPTDAPLFAVHIEANPAFGKDTVREPNYLTVVREDALAELLHEMTDSCASEVFGTGFVREGLLHILPATQEFQRRIYQLSELPPEKVEEEYLNAEQKLLDEIKLLPIDARAMIMAILDTNGKIGVVAAYLRETIILNLHLPPIGAQEGDGTDRESYHFRAYDLLQNTLSGVCMPITTVLPAQHETDSL
jgi:hypothetical protein